MSNKQASQIAKRQGQITPHFLRVGALYLCLVATPVTVLAQLSASVPVGATSTIPVQTNEPKLTYKASGSKLTVEELGAAQQKKLEDDFFKKAGYTSVASLVIKPTKVNAGAVAGAIPVSTLFVSGVYGTVAKQKAEVVWNGVVSTVEVGAILGKVTIESIHPGRVTVVFAGKTTKVNASNHKSKKQTPAPATTLRQTMKVGESLEIPA